MIKKVSFGKRNNRLLIKNEYYMFFNYIISVRC